MILGDKTMRLRAFNEIGEVVGERHVLITEVTRMSGGIVCVAAIDIHSGAMVRPLTIDGSNWEEAEWVTTDYISVGNILSLTPATDQGSPEYPHATEDFRVAKVTVVGHASQKDLYDACRETANANIEGIFGGSLLDGKYVVAGTHSRSLGCVMVPRASIKLSDAYEKVQLSYRDDSGTWHNLTVTELETKNAGTSSDGAGLLKARLDKTRFAQPVGLRVGLARAWDGGAQRYNPKRCYIQINGIIVPNWRE